MEYGGAATATGNRLSTCKQRQSAHYRLGERRWTKKRRASAI